VSLCPDLDKVSSFLRTAFEIDLQDNIVVVVNSVEEASRVAEDADLVVVGTREELATVREVVARPLVWIKD
jgi:hypothetical protein